jgi:virginiamycin B lyase
MTRFGSRSVPAGLAYGGRVLVLLSLCVLAAAAAPQWRSYAVPAGSHPHDVAPAADGAVWYTAQRKGVLGRLDPSTGKVEEIRLGADAAPHGVIIGPDGAPWVTDGGLNAIVRVDPVSHAVKVFPLPAEHPRANLNTATFDHAGVLWFTGQGGIYGRLDPRTGQVRVWDAPRGWGPYGITTTPDGHVWYASLAGGYIAEIDTATGAARVVQPPIRNQGARRIWADRAGGLWVSFWNAGRIARFDPRSGQWRMERLPGADPEPYAIYVDQDDEVWVSDWGANAILRFDPASGQFASFPLQRRRADIRQMAGRPGEVWAAESGTDHLDRISTRP